MAKKITWQNGDFKIGAVSMDDIPPTRLNEVAFCGKSNVGKSSLINAVTKRNNLVRTSKTPGCTRQLNFFEIDEKIYLVDMPGYGFAARGKQEIAGWSLLIKQYLTGRVNLRRIFLLIDSRRGLKEHDAEIMDVLDEYEEDRFLQFKQFMNSCVWEQLDIINGEELYLQGVDTDIYEVIETKID